MLYDMRGYMGLALSANGWSYEERWFKYWCGNRCVHSGYYFCGLCCAHDPAGKDLAQRSSACLCWFDNHFFSRGQNLIGVILGLTCGILVAVAIEPVTGIFMKKENVEKKSDKAFLEEKI